MSFLSRILPHVSPLAVMALLSCGTAFGSSTAFGKTRTVTTLQDDVPGSLREALQLSAKGDSINFAKTGNLFLFRTLEVRAQNLTINGPGADRLSIIGTDTEGVLLVRQGASVKISGLKFRGGTAQAGGGISNEGNTTLLDCAVVGNHATLALNSNAGGGISNIGTLVIRRCLIARNTVTNGPGGGIVTAGSLVITNSTVANNRIRNDEAFTGETGVSSGGGKSVSGTNQKLIVRSCTISGNSIISQGVLGSANGGGIGNNSNNGNPDVVNRVTNSLIAQNSTSANIGPDVSGSFQSGGFNLIGKGNDSTGFTNGMNHDRVGGMGSSPLNPKLGPLADNGGPTATMKLLSGSPAIDHGRSSAVYDQRGFTRQYDFPAIADAAADNSSDIGAFERGSSLP